MYVGIGTNTFQDAWCNIYSNMFAWPRSRCQKSGAPARKLVSSKKYLITHPSRQWRPKHFVRVWAWPSNIAGLRTCSKKMGAFHGRKPLLRHQNVSSKHNANLQEGTPPQNHWAVGCAIKICTKAGIIVGEVQLFLPAPWRPQENRRRGRGGGRRHFLSLEQGEHSESKILQSQTFWLEVATWEQAEADERQCSGRGVVSKMLRP